MNHDTKKHLFPSLIEEVLSHPGHCVDNIFASVWQGLNVSRLIEKAGFRKRTGVPVIDAVFLLILWKWIEVSSISAFCQRSLKTFSEAKKDVVYDLLKREDINWRGLNSGVAKTLYQQQKLGASRVRAYVIDDSVKVRHGRKMEAVSSHFDHTEGRHVMGQQVLTLGLATETLFLPLDSQIYVSDTKSQGLIREFKDQRSIVAKRYEEATTQAKPAMAEGMLKRAKRQGIEADYLVADAWFGTKPMIRAAQSLEITAVLRMKKGNMKYRTTRNNGRTDDLDAQSLYRRAVKGEWKKVRGMPYKAVSIDVELDIAEQGKKEPQWIQAKLLFVRGAACPDKAKAGKKDWALFLTTAPEMSMTKMLEVYALRWGIEVYFKEAKQHLGFLREQTWTFASHTASIHLTAIRYLMLVCAKQGHDEARICDVRSRMKDQLTTLDFEQRLWQIFRALICGRIESFKDHLGKTTGKLITAIDNRIDDFLFMPFNSMPLH